jgi:hypothetical protein
LIKESKAYVGEKIASSMNGGKKTGYVQVEHQNFISVPHFVQKKNSKWSNYVNVRHETLNLLEENRKDFKIEAETELSE